MSVHATSKNPISIAMLFYVLTLAGILASCFGRLETNGSVTQTAITWALIIGSVTGTVLGMVGGAFYFRSAKAAVITLLIGGVLGAAGGVLTLIREKHYLSILTIAFAGCWLLIVLMLLKARFSTFSPIAVNQEAQPSPSEQ